MYYRKNLIIPLSLSDITNTKRRMGIGSDQVFSEIKGNRNIYVKKDDFKSQNECLWTIQQLLNDLPQFSVVCNCPIIEYKCYNNSGMCFLF